LRRRFLGARPRETKGALDVTPIALRQRLTPAQDPASDRFLGALFEVTPPPGTHVSIPEYMGGGMGTVISSDGKGNVVVERDSYPGAD